MVPGNTTVYDIGGLQEDSGYTVGVSALVGTREGNPVTVSTRTGEKGSQEREQVVLLGGL